MSFSSAARRRNIYIVFGLVFCWKVILLATSLQPVPSNDAFFYDGPVVNYLRNGAYCNPPLSVALPISGKEVFCAYPPVYQAALFGWMSVFGASAASAMVMHLLLFGAYMLILLAIFRRLETPPWCVNMAGAFLLLITFHDRPDSLAYVFGMGSVYAWIRSRKILNGKHLVTHSGIWAWTMAVLVVLCLATSLQIGAIYFFWMWLGMLATRLLGKEAFPWPQMIFMSIMPVILVLFVRFAFPHLWAGFLEHARQAPSITGLRRIYVAELLKIGRTVPGILLAAVFLPWVWLKQRRDFESPLGMRHELVLIPALLTGLAMVAACLLFVTANAVIIADYLQPLIVAGYLTLCGAIFVERRRFRGQVILFALALCLGSIRAVGMSTWGVLCSRDVSYSLANDRVLKDLKGLKPGSVAVLSSAYLYAGTTQTNAGLIHSDWMRKAKGSPYGTDYDAFVALKPAELILTQFDYYRRYKPILERAKSHPEMVQASLEDMAKIPTPDSIPLLHQVLQHVSWAPILVKLSWQTEK